jgi:hypothetical protein
MIPPKNVHLYNFHIITLWETLITLLFTKTKTIPNGEHVFDKDFDNPVIQSAFKQMIEFFQYHLTE